MRDSSDVALVARAMAGAWNCDMSMSKVGLRVCMYVCMYVCVYVWLSDISMSTVGLLVSMYVCMYVCMYVWCLELRHIHVEGGPACMYLCMYVCVYIHGSRHIGTCNNVPYIHTHKHTYIRT